MGNHILPANPARYADDFRTDTMGILVIAEMGRCMGKVDDTLFDGAFLRSHALLRWFLRAATVRHRAVHTGGEPDGDNGERADDGRLPAELLLLGRLSDGGKHCSPEMPEPCAGPGGMDDTGRRYGIQYPKLWRGCGFTGSNVHHGGDSAHDEIRDYEKLRMMNEDFLKIGSELNKIEKAVW